LFVSAGLAAWPQEVPWAVVNLDLAPEVRYHDLLMSIVNTNGWEYTYGQVEGYWDTLPTIVQDFMELVSMDLERYFPKEYAHELLGLEQAVIQVGHGDDFPLKEIVALNLLYEWTSACTSTIVEDPTGRMWHARNMDWNFDGWSLFNLTRLIQFQKDRQTVYTGVQWVGYLGILSGSNKGFTVTVDQREADRPRYITDNMEAIINGAQTIGFELRTVLATRTTFTDAVNDLATTDIAAPVYYNIGGSNKGEGSIITRNRAGNATDIWKWGSGPQPCCPDIQNWYLVETNWDHWTTDGDDRQESAIASLNALGQANVNADNLFAMLATPPVLAKTTQYSMVVQNGGSYFRVKGWQ